MTNTRSGSSRPATAEEDGGGKESPSAQPAKPARRRTYHPRPRLTRLGDVLNQAAAALRARAKARDVAFTVEITTERQVAHIAALREAFLVLLADTLDTTDHGGFVRVRLRDLAGGRVEFLIEDGARRAELVDRALQKKDGSGRARSLARAFERLAAEHQARWVSHGDEDGRRLLVDIGFPSEPE